MAKWNSCVKEYLFKSFILLKFREINAFIFNIEFSLFYNILNNINTLF